MVAGLLALAGLGAVVPTGTLCYWIAQSRQTTLPAAASLGQATWATVTYTQPGQHVRITTTATPHIWT